MWTHGVVSSLGFNNDKPYVKGSKAYPSPILIRRFKGKLPLEEVAKMATKTESINPRAPKAPDYLKDKHFFRKHGANAYYGQN